MSYFIPIAAYEANQIKSSNDIFLRPGLFKLNSFNRIFIYLITLLLIISKVNIGFGSERDNIIENIKSYIENMRLVEISFDQTDSKGMRASGILVINKPYKFRVNYFEPFPILIVGNKNYVSIYDYDMETLSRVKAEENIFKFLLVDQINFENQFEIIAATEVNDQYRLKVKHLDSGRSSEIEFNKNTRNIETMKIIEENNIITLKFGQTKHLKSIKSNLFILQDPDIFGKPERLNKEKLQMNYQ